MANTDQQESVSEAELNQAVTRADHRHKKAMSRWRQKDSVYANLLKTRWMKSERSEIVEPRQRKSYFGMQHEVLEKTITDFCEAIVERTDACTLRLKNRVKEDRSQWKEVQQMLSAYIRRVPAHRQWLAQIVRWQNVAFLAENIPSHSGHGLKRLRTTVSTSYQLVSELWESLGRVMAVHPRLRNRLTSVEEQSPSNTDDASGGKSSHGE